MARRNASRKKILFWRNIFSNYRAELPRALLLEVFFIHGISKICTLPRDDGYSCRFFSSTRGLDSSTALEYVRALRIATDIIRHTTIVSIYQAGEKLYEVFDKVCLIYEGRMVYFGPADQAREYFIDMGYEPANRQTTADFLVAVTDPLGRKQRKDYDPSVHGPLPQTPAAFESYYRNSDLRKMNFEDLKAYKRDFVREDKSHAYLESARAEHSHFSRKKVCFIHAQLYVEWKTHGSRRAPIRFPYRCKSGASCCVERRSSEGNGLQKPCRRRASSGYSPESSCSPVLRMFIIQAIIIGTVFANLPEATSAYFSRGGVLFL